MLIFMISDDTKNKLHEMLQGLTFKVEGGELVIARILHGGMVDQQGLLHVGDIIKEVLKFCSAHVNILVSFFI